ncbi:MAG: response regulator [Planctomycetaceae bacterium]|nr:response regulator [Planctomycetaceae bacterium]
MTRRLLVTDDAIIIREMIKDAAMEAGWDIAGEASNGEEAVAKYLELRPDACTLDLVMPHYDGLHGLRGILAADPQARVCVVSALDQKHVLKEAFQIGAADFIVKPFDRKFLIETLDKLVPAALGKV